MGQKISPIGLRTGVTQDWSSRWYASKQEFGRLLVEDQKIRDFVKKNYRYAGIPKIEIERVRDEVKVILHTARPGVIIGRKGAEVDRLRDQLEDLTGRRVAVNIKEVGQPELEAQLMAESVAEQLEKNASFRRTMRRAVETAMNAGAQGIRVMVSGRLAGSEMARRSHVSEGRIPLQTLSADISYGFTEATTPYGHIGVKVWINRGPFKSVKEEEKTSAPDAQARVVPEEPARQDAGPGNPREHG
jgi:small subunit ribosomal protein S3